MHTVFDGGSECVRETVHTQNVWVSVYVYVCGCARLCCPHDSYSVIAA